MVTITKARAFANNEVAFLAWETDPPRIPRCLGFHIVREYLDEHDAVIEERPLAAYVPFKGQSNLDWEAQNTTVWPVQKFTWRDLTLRKRRNAAERRPDNVRVRYRIRAVGRLTAGMEKVDVVAESHFDSATHARVAHTYQGTPVPLGYLTPAAFSNIVDVTRVRGAFTSTFTNGILSTQFLLNVLQRDGKIEPGELEAHLRAPDDWLRNYLSGDVLPLVSDFFASQPGGRFHAALYELEDEQLLDLLNEHAERLDLILSDAGSSTGEEDEDTGKKTTEYDTRNQPARKMLIKRAKQAGTKFRLQHRLFNGSGHIGHNKFVVYVDDHGIARSVLTGSTNWTWSGLAGQSNNCIRIDEQAVAAAFLDYWKRLHADVQKVPRPQTAASKDANQSDALKTANRTSTRIELADGGAIETWFSPNMTGKEQPPSRTASKPDVPPPDMNRLFSLMRKAQHAIFFAVFMPSRGGAHSIVSAAVDLGLKDTSLQVVGAISDTQAMWGYEASKKTADGKKVPAWSPHVFRQEGVSVVRATALTDKEIGRQLGNFQFDEKLTVGRAIIHDKILVIDPLDPVRCVVAFGSHNLGYKASYSNDENLVIITGQSALAQAYMVHVMDVYDHYRFRAVEAERNPANAKPGKTKPSDKQWSGFLDTTDAWQQKSSRSLARYLTD